MSKGWGAVTSVGASLLARGQRKRDLEDEYKLKSKYAQEEFDREAPKRELLLALERAKIETEEAKRKKYEAEGFNAELRGLAGFAGAGGNTFIARNPLGEGWVEGEVELSPDVKYRVDSANARTDKSIAARIEAARIAAGKQSTYKPTDHTSKIAEIDGKIAALYTTASKAKLANELREAGVIPSNASPEEVADAVQKANWETEFALKTQRDRLLGAQVPSPPKAGGVAALPVLPSAEQDEVVPEEELTESDRRAIALAERTGAPISITEPELLKGGPKADANKGKVPGSSKDNPIPVGWGTIDSVADGTWIKLPNGKVGQK